MASQSSYPKLTIPGIPTHGPCCLWQIHKKLDGYRQVRFGKQYKCDLGETSRGVTVMHLKLLSAGLPCDQEPDPQGPNFMPDGSSLNSKGITIRRSDGFAEFFGSFIIRDSADIQVFRGKIALSDKVGTHVEPFGREKCNARNHIEGWLVGKGTPKVPYHTLRALLVARGQLTRSAQRAQMSGYFNGSLVKCG